MHFSFAACVLRLDSLERKREKSQSMITHFIKRLTHTNVWESIGKHCSCTQFIKSLIFTTSHARIRISTASYVKICFRYYKSRENPYQVLQVTCTASERAMKSKVHMIKSLPPKYPAIAVKYHQFVAVGIVTRPAHP